MNTKANISPEWSYRKFSSGSGGPVVIPPEAGSLTGIVISQLPYRLEYLEGDIFNIKGLKVEATSENNIKIDVTKKCTIFVNKPLTVEDNIVTVKYEEFETTFNITVKQKSLDIPPNTEVLMHCDNNLIDEITGKDYKNSSATVNYVLGKFGSGYSSNEGIYIGPDSLPTWLDLLNGAASATFQFWFKWNSSSSFTSGSLNWINWGNNNGLILKLQSNSLTIYLLNSGSVSIGITDWTKTGWHHLALVYDKGYLSVFYDGQKKLYSEALKTTSSSYAVKGIFLPVNNSIPLDEILISTSALYTEDFKLPTSEYGGIATLSKIYVEQKPDKTIYKSGETFDLTGVKIMAIFSDGTAADVTSECVIENNDPINSTDKFRIVSYTNDGITKKVYINIGVYAIDRDVDLSSVKLLMPFDSSTQDLTGLNTPTIVGNDLYSEGKFGMARYFNGSTDYISMPIENINFSTGDFTIAFWAKTIVENSFGIMIGNYKYYTDGGYIGGLRIGIETDNTLFCTLNKNANDGGENIYVISTHTHKLNNNILTHFALVRKGNSITFYVDGYTLGTVEYTGDLYVCDLFTIGARDGGTSSVNITNYFNGYIDDLIITKSALWDGEFTPPTKPFSKV